MTAGPLDGIRVLDLSSVVMGPYATQQLGDLGAEVILVEPVEGGGARLMGPGPHPDMSGIALNLLRNKRSLAINLKSAAGRNVVLRLAERCDVLVTNLRPKPLARLGLDYESITKVRADIVFCQAQGFSSDSGRGDDPAYDDVIQAESGIADAAARAEGRPRLAPTILADKVCGLFVANAVLAALLHRARTGEGQRIEAPMLDSMTSFILVEHGAGAISEPATGPVGWSRILTPLRGPQQTADGWINILPYSTAAYNALFENAGRPEWRIKELSSRELSQQVEMLYPRLNEVVRTQSTAHWLEFCDRHSIPVGRVVTLDELVAELPLAQHPRLGTYRVIPPPISFGATPLKVRRHAPLPGDDSVDILAELGLTPAEIATLAADGVVRVPPKSTE